MDIKNLIKKYASQNNNLTFEEHKSGGYKQRTIENANADATIAFAVDFTTAGEVLTMNAVRGQEKTYIPIPVDNMNEFVDFAINSLNIWEHKTLNIAGNGIYTLKGRYTQLEVDRMTFNFLNEVLSSPRLLNKIELIRSGGQTGFDEAGIKAAIKLGIPSLILAPKGWRFRDASGNDIEDETAFKKRFKSI